MSGEGSVTVSDAVMKAAVSVSFATIVGFGKHSRLSSRSAKSWNSLQCILRFAITMAFSFSKSLWNEPEK